MLALAFSVELVGSGSGTARGVSRIFDVQRLEELEDEFKVQEKSVYQGAVDGLRDWLQNLRTQGKKVGAQKILKYVEKHYELKIVNGSGRVLENHADYTSSDSKVKMRNELAEFIISRIMAEIIEGMYKPKKKKKKKKKKDPEEGEREEKEREEEKLNLAFVQDAKFLQGGIKGKTVSLNALRTVKARVLDVSFGSLKCLADHKTPANHCPVCQQGFKMNPDGMTGRWHTGWMCDPFYFAAGWSNQGFLQAHYRGQLLMPFDDYSSLVRSLQVVDPTITGDEEIFVINRLTGREALVDPSRIGLMNMRKIFVGEHEPPTRFMAPFSVAKKRAEVLVHKAPVKISASKKKKKSAGSRPTTLKQKSARGSGGDVDRLLQLLRELV